MIWVVGASGMLGQELALRLKTLGWPHVLSDRDVDFTQPESLEAFARGKPIQWIVNAAAYTAVDKAEDEPDLCRQVNVHGPLNLAKLARNLGAKLIHLSTDYVFSGQGVRPWVETDPVDPQSVYGRTKADGERAVAEECPDHYILRTAWLYGAFGPNFVFTMLRLMREKESLRVVADQWGAPTWTVDLVGVIETVIGRGSWAPGIYHVSNNGQTHWHGFAEQIQTTAQQLGLLDPRKTIPIAPVTTAEYPTKAQRPAWSVLDKTKVEAALGYKLPLWQESLNQFLEAEVKKGRE